MGGLAAPKIIIVAAGGGRKTALPAGGRAIQMFRRDSDARRCSTRIYELEDLSLGETQTEETQFLRIQSAFRPAPVSTAHFSSPLAHSFATRLEERKLR